MKQIFLTLSLCLSSLFYGQSITELKQKAEQGNAYAQNKLGYAYANGKGIKQSYTQAVYWWKKAAEQGNAYAQYNLGIAYYNGKGIEQSYSQTVYWLRKAAEQGYAEALSSGPADTEKDFHSGLIKSVGVNFRAGKRIVDAMKAAGFEKKK